MFFKALSLLVLSAPVFATVFITSPTANSNLHGGQEASINWQDDGQAPSLTQFGNSNISIYVGNAQQQTLLQPITTVDVSTTQGVKFTPDPKIGPNDANYFIRVESLVFKDPKDTTGQLPALAFSAKFSLDNMSGTYSDAIKAQIDGQSTAPLAGQTAASSSSSSASSKPASTTNASSTGSKAASSTSSGAGAAKTSNAALGVKAGWAGVTLGALIGVSMF